VPLRLDEGGPIARRYGIGAAKEWQRVRAHFALGEGFALLVLIVPDADGARLCRAEVEAILSPEGLRLWTLPITVPEDLPRETSRLPTGAPERDIGGVWTRVQQIAVGVSLASLVARVVFPRIFQAMTNGEPGYQTPALPFRDHGAMNPA
jgi:hypothetical protein